MKLEARGQRDKGKRDRGKKMTKRNLKLVPFNMVPTDAGQSYTHGSQFPSETSSEQGNKNKKEKEKRD